MFVITVVLALQSHSSVEHFTVDGVDRVATVIVGEGREPHPLVFAFHGHGGNMQNSARMFHVERLWPEATVIYPEGLPTKGRTDPEGLKRGWQQRPGENGDRDVKFVDAMLASMKHVDPKRIYAMGHSNGGRFTYLLWALRGDIFAAYGPSGSPATGLVRQFKPASVFHTAGEKDQIVPYAGQKLTIEALQRLDGAEIQHGTTVGYVTLFPAKNGLEVGTYISPMGHAFPPDAVAATVELLRRHSK